MTRIAVLWDDEVSLEGDAPFSDEAKDYSYKYFTEYAEERSGEVYVSSFETYEEGSLTEAFRWNGERWVKESDVEIDVVFDKYKFDEATRDLKQEIDRNKPVLNCLEVETLCKDKLKTYRKFSEMVPETAEADESTVEKFIEKYGKAVLKPNYGFGGHGVSKIDSIEDFESGEGILVQEPVGPGENLPRVDFSGYHDYRVMVLDGQPVATYYRMNEEDFRANMSQGARKEYVDVEEMPEEVRSRAERVAEQMPSSSHLMSIDFMFDTEGEPRLIELNSKPGLLIHADDNKKGRKHVLEAVVEKLVN